MDARLDENQPEFAVLVLAVPLQMLPDRDGFLDEVVQILRDVGLQAHRLHDPQDLVAVHKPNLCHSMGITEDDAWKKMFLVPKT